MLTNRDIKRVNRYINKKGLALFIVDLDGFKTALETAPRGLTPFTGFRYPNLLI